MATLDDIVRILRQSPTPLSIADIVKECGGDIRACDAILWGNPEQFVWQPGNKWAVARTRSHGPRETKPETPDARSAEATNSPGSGQLRALTLSNGLTVSVDRRPLDSDAFFSVRTVGSRIVLTLNSSHELFEAYPMPFAEEGKDLSYKELCELMVSAWALYEDGLPEGSSRRAAQDARFLWGRRAVEMLRESNER